MRKIGSIVCFALILFQFFSCSKKDDWKGEIEYIDNIKVVTNYNIGIWEDNRFPFTNIGMTSFGSPISAQIH